MEQLLIEIATIGYDRGNPLRGYAAYAIWFDGERLSESACVLDGIPRGSNSLGVGYAQSMAIEEAYMRKEPREYSVIFYGTGIISPEYILKKGEPMSFGRYFIPSARYKDFLQHAYYVREHNSYRDVPDYIEKFRDRHGTWALSGKSELCPLNIDRYMVVPGYIMRLSEYGI